VKEGEDIILKTGKGETAGSFDDILVFYQGDSEAVCGSATLDEAVPGQEYVVTVSVPEGYLNPETAVYPIVIDPSLNFQSNSISIEDVTVYSNTTSSGTSGSLFAGLHSSYGKCRTLMRFPDFDAAVNSIHLDPDCVALAYVELRDIICDSNPLTVYCHEYTGNAWQESGNPSWASLGTSFVGQLLDQRTVSYGYGQQSGSGTNHRYRFNITDTVKDWIQNPGEASKGLVFKASDSFETGGTYLRKTFASHNRATYQPSITVIYNNRYLVSLNDESYYDNVCLKPSCNCYGYAMRLNYLDEDPLEGCNKYNPGEIWNKSIIPQPQDGYSILWGPIINNSDLQNYYSHQLLCFLFIQ